MACFSFCGLYLYRRGQKARGALLFVLAMVFMVNTGSKTTAGLVPLAMLIVVVPGLYGARFFTPVLFCHRHRRNRACDARHRVHRSAEAARRGRIFRN